ncbi:unnamed protein product, partial [marine sediment metagenome]
MGGTQALALEDDFDAKFIILRRPLEDTWAAYVDKVNYRCNSLKEAEIEAVRSWKPHPSLRMDQIIDKLAAQHPDKFMILNIEDVVVDYEKIMPKIAEFIGIDMNEILLRPTFHGRELPNSDDYIGKVNDAGRSRLLSPKSRHIFELQY